MAKVRLLIAPGGKVVQSFIEDQGKYSANPLYRALVDTVRRGVSLPICQTLRPPPDSSDFFSVHPDVVLTFDARDILSGK